MVLDLRYLDSKNMAAARSAYSSQSPRSIRLESFFHHQVFVLLLQKIENSSFKERFHPEKHLYEVSKVKEIDSFINGPYFRNLVNQVLGFKKFKLSYEIRKFSPGSYTLLHDAEDLKPGIDFIIDFSTSRGFGGHTTFLTEDEELLTSSPLANSVTFIERKKGVMRFTKYVQHSQRTPLFQVVGTILPGRNLG